MKPRPHAPTPVVTTKPRPRCPVAGCAEAGRVRCPAHGALLCPLHFRGHGLSGCSAASEPPRLPAEMGRRASAPGLVGAAAARAVEVVAVGAGARMRRRVG